MKSPRTVYMIMVWEVRLGKMQVRTLTAAFSSRRLAEMVGQQMVMDGVATKYRVSKVEVDDKNMLADLLERRTSRRQNPSGKKGDSLKDIPSEDLIAEYDAMKKSGHRSSVADMSKEELESAFEDLQKRSRKSLLKKGIDPDKLLGRDVKAVFGPRARVGKGRKLIVDKPLRRGKLNTFNVNSGKILITSPEFSRDQDFDLMHELKACNGKWKSRAIMETIQFSDGKGLSPIGFEAWCDNPSKSGRWRKLRKSAITDVAMTGIFDSGSYPKDKNKTEHQYWKVILPKTEKRRSSDRDFLLSVDKYSVIFETMNDGAFAVWVREDKSKKIDAVVIGFDEDIDNIFEQKMFMDGDIPSKPMVTQKGSVKSTNTKIPRKTASARVQKAPSKPKAKDLIAECRSLWEAYCKRPGKVKLRKVERHCNAMKTSKYKTVKDERRRCMNAVRREMKKLGMK